MPQSVQPGEPTEYSVWNTLHDGTIEAIEGNLPGAVVVRVSIPYPCDELPTASEYLSVRLPNCTRFEYLPFDASPIVDLPSIVASDVIILSAEAGDGTVSVLCVEGTLRLASAAPEIVLAEGTTIPQLELEQAARRYWNAWARSRPD